MFLNEKNYNKIMNVLFGGGKVSLVCTQANLDEMGGGDYNVIFKEPIESDLKGWYNGVSKYVFECNDVVKNNANYFSKKPHGYIQTIIGLEIIDSNNKIIFDDDSIIDVDEYYYN